MQNKLDGKRDFSKVISQLNSLREMILDNIGQVETIDNIKQRINNDDFEVDKMLKEMAEMESRLFEIRSKGLLEWNNVLNFGS